jgi:protein ImuB
MFWIALHCPREEDLLPWGWRALQFTPRVARAEGCVLLEASASEQLFGGRRALLARLLEADGLAPVPWACGSTSLVALALLRLKLRGTPRPARLADLPLDVLTAAAGHVDTLERTGCRTWGELRALPRGGVARRFGAALLAALDAAHGERPERYDWITLPEAFDLKLELVALATTAPELMGAGQRLLDLLQAWLQARNRGVLALELEWTLDLRRLDGKPLPPTECLQVRTAQPTQDMAHLRRLVNEQLARAPLAAPANHLRLRTLETLPWSGASRSFLPGDNVQGERLHQLVERLGARLGAGSVTVAQLQSDHRPERMQAWVPARDAMPASGPAPADDALYPAWVLPQPLPLEMRDDVAWYGGPLRPLTRVHRVETAWWEEGGPALRDYYIAHSETAGLVWVYREQPLRAAKERWFLQGLYA